MMNVTLCMENALYRRYIEEKLKQKGYEVTIVRESRLARTIAENPSGILLLQSDSAETSLIELAGKLKRIFGRDITIILLSSDYLTKNNAGVVVDRFFHFPVPYEVIEEAIDEIQNDVRRILIVDDSKLVHNHLTPPLEDAGYDVAGAYDGRDGLEKARALRPDLIICDIEMPEMNGFEVCATIRNMPGIKDTYIIMSSTLSSSSDQQKGFEAGVDEYIIKPVVIPELLDRIKKVFRSSLAGRERILVLEPDERIGGTIVKSLVKQGFMAQVTGSIAAGMQILGTMAHDLVISELDLPDGNAVDLAAGLNTLEEQKQPDMLIITSRDSQADSKMVMNAGAAGVISKPFSMDTLLAMVERILAGRQAALEKSHLEKYLSKASLRMALEKSILSGKESSIRADKKVATIFFSDIVSFTSRCERYSPRQIVTQLNLLFDVVTRVIMGNEGDIDKFIGDSCMAFWLDDDPGVSAERAIRSAIALRKEIARMNEKHAVLTKDPIRIRFGINTGDVILCDIGSADARIDLTTIGDSVNIASRLESGSKQYGIDNLISADTISHHLDRFGARIIDYVKVKGKNRPVECFELFDIKEQLTEDEIRLITRFNEGIHLYQDKAFEQALAIFRETESLEKRTAEGEINPSRIYQERCCQLMEHCPEDWCGVRTMEEK